MFAAIFSQLCQPYWHDFSVPCRMKQLQESVLIYSPIKEVFGTLANPENHTNFDEEITRAGEKISEGPIGKGSRFTGYFKGLGKIDYEYSKFKENQLIEQTLNASIGKLYHSFVFEHTTGGTRLTQKIHVEPNIWGLIAWPVMVKGISKRIHALNVSLKNYFEGGRVST